MGFPRLLLPLSVDHFAEQMVNEIGVLIMPGSVINYPGNYFRLGFGKKSMPEVLERFEQFLEKF